MSVDAGEEKRRGGYQGPNPDIILAVIMQAHGIRSLGAPEGACHKKNASMAIIRIR
jgi:hypothetical protein